MQIEPPELTPERAALVLAMAPQTLVEPQDAASVTISAALPVFDTEAARRTDEQVDAWEFENEVKPNLKSAGVPERFWNLLREWNCEPQRRVYERTKALCGKVGATVVLTGKRGTGKTTIAVQLIIDRARNEKLPPWERNPPYRKFADVIARYKPLYADFGSVEMDQLMTGRDAFCRRSLVVLDEIHESQDMKLRDRVLTDIIDRRYAGKKDTIVISNQTQEEFRASVSSSILSRISEHGMIIPCEWESWRK